MFEGIGIYKEKNIFKLEGEFRSGKPHGKTTIYTLRGGVYN